MGLIQGLTTLTTHAEEQAPALTLLHSLCLANESALLDCRREASGLERRITEVRARMEPQHRHTRMLTLP